MKIAYQDKDCHMIQAGDWTECKGCVFQQTLSICQIWPCDLIPGIKCGGLDIYTQTDELEEIFTV